MRVTATVNGETRQADDVWEGESLLYVLRERMGLPGSKNACEQGECGSCTIYLDDMAVCACLVAAGQAQGRTIVTVEGLASGDVLHPVQQAFVEAGAVPGGVCTPGVLVAAHDLPRGGGGPPDAGGPAGPGGAPSRGPGHRETLAAGRTGAGAAGGARWRDGGPGPGRSAGPAARARRAWSTPTITWTSGRPGAGRSTPPWSAG